MSEMTTERGLDADAATATFSKMLLQETPMREGLLLIKLPGYYGPTKICWVVRKNGDEWEMLPGARLVSRTAGDRVLEQLAADGPMNDHKVWPPAKLGEPLHRLVPWRTLYADEKAWAEHCPKPKDWKEP